MRNLAGKTKKYKRLTNKEKQVNKEIKAELRSKGIIPPVKPKLNRKKFALEVIEEFEAFNTYDNLIYLHRAITCMMPSLKLNNAITPEQIGILKVAKIAMEYKRFVEDLKARDKTNYNIGELYEKVIAPIVNL